MHVLLLYTQSVSGGMSFNEALIVHSPFIVTMKNLAWANVSFDEKGEYKIEAQEIVYLFAFAIVE